jgi:hypothetical protein
MRCGGGCEEQQKLLRPASSLDSAGVSQATAVAKVSGADYALVNHELERA